jgi:hypothetical protein
MHSKIFTSLVLGQKSLNNISFRGHQIITLPVMPAHYGQPCMLPIVSMDVLNGRNISDPCLELKRNSSVIQPMEVTIPTELSHLLHRPEEMEVDEKPSFRFFLSMYILTRVYHSLSKVSTWLSSLQCTTPPHAISNMGNTELKDEAQ